MCSRLRSLFGLEAVLYTLLAFFVMFKTCNAFTDVFDRKKEYLFSYAMNDDITQEIMARCKNVKEILELD